MPQVVTNLRGSLLHCLFTLTGSPVMKNLGGLFSVALSVASRHLGVTQRYALRSSDFPPVLQRVQKPAIAQLTCFYYE